MTKTSRSKPIPSEYDEQVLVCRYLDFLCIEYVHIPNEGIRSERTGARLKKIGLKKGFPDLFIIRPCGKYHGLFIEMKSIRGTATLEQKEWIIKLNSLGYKAVICRGFEAAKETIDKYIKEEL